jgi:hypothetical protein
VNVIHLKADMRAYAQTHGLALPHVNYRSPVWGIGARRLAWRVSGHKRPGYATTSKAELWDMFHPLTFAQHVVALAKAEIGTTEHPAGSNDGGRVHLYQKTTGAFREPWCASFAMWLEQEAAKRMDRHLKWFPNPAWVPNWTAAFGGKLFAAVPFEDAKSGDVVTLWQSEHIETVLRREGDWLICIGGNTSPVGKSSNGGMVAQTKRHRSEVTRIGRRRI